MSEVKAVILARGLGTRMREPDARVALRASETRAAELGCKIMMPIRSLHDGRGPSASRPFLDHVLSGLADAGFCQVGVVVGPEHGWIRERYTREQVPTRVRLSWIVQAEPRGTADAVLAARAWTGNAAFVVVNGDNLYPVEALAALRALEGPGLAAFDRGDLVRLGNIAAERVASFAMVRTDATGFLTEILEKPTAALLEEAGGAALVSMNCWRFDARIYDACRDLPLSPRGELELPAAVSLALGRGVRFRALAARGEVIDLSRRVDVASASERLAGRRPQP